MKRRMAVGLLGLALVGCAQSKPLLTKADKPAPAPVAITPVPSIHDTINRGLGGSALAATTLPDPTNPRWAGRVPPPGTDPTPPTAIAAKGPAPVATPLASPSSPVAGAVAAATPAAGFSVPSAAATETMAPPAPMSAGPGLSASSAALSSPVSIATGVGGQRSGSSPASASRSAALEPAAVPHVDAGDLPVASGLPPLSAASTATAPATAPAAMAGAPTSPASRPDSDPAVNVSSVPPKSQTAPVVRRVSDPLLGPNPDLMPTLPPLPDPVKAPKAAAPGPAPAAIESTPPASSAVEPLASPPISAGDGGAMDVQPAPAAPAGAKAPAGSAPPSLPELPPQAAPGSASAAAPARLPIADLRIEPAPGAPAPGDPPPAGRPPRRDGRVVLASLPIEKLESAPKKRPRNAGRPVARVGEEVITFHDVILATRDKIAQIDRLSPPGDLSPEEQKERRKQVYFVFQRMLDQLVEQTMIAQEAKRRVKDPKQLDRLIEGADKWWREEELPSLKRQNQVKTEQELSEVLAKRGGSLEAKHREFRQTFLAQTFLRHELKDRVKVELPDLLRYYNEHLKDHRFDRPASITWREIVIEPVKYKTPDEARRKAIALHERVMKGESFANLARQESDGPTTSRLAGGLMKTAPGAYRVAAVNQALENLPIGRPSELIEGADGYHIVRVEARRAAGPASFEEVQDEIKPLLIRRKEQEETLAFLAKLRERTLITTMFDSTPNDLNRTGE